MPDVHVLLSAFRDELRTIEGRRAELRGQLEALEQQHDRLETTISVLEDRVGAAPSSGPENAAPEEVPLVDRIVDALGTSGLRRPETLQIFKPQGFSESAIDSAVSRLLKNGRVRRQGRRVVRVELASRLPEPVAPDPVVTGPGDPGGLESGADPMPDTQTVDRGSQDRVSTDGPRDPASAAAAARGPVAGDDGRPLTDQVRDAIAGGVRTRQELLEQFGRRGVPARPVDHALSGLRKKKELAPLPPGQLALADPREPFGSSRALADRSGSRVSDLEPGPQDQDS